MSQANLHHSVKSDFSQSHKLYTEYNVIKSVSDGRSKSMANFVLALRHQDPGRRLECLRGYGVR